MQVERFRSQNRGERGFPPNRSKQSDSGAPSTPTGQSQLWKWTKCRSANRAGVDIASYESGQSAGGVCGRDESGAEARNPGPGTRSVPVLVLRRRPRRGPGPERLTPKVGAGDHPGEDAQPTMNRLALLGGACRRSPLRRRPAIGRWSPRQLLHLSAVCCGSTDRGTRKRV